MRFNTKIRSLILITVVSLSFQSVGFAQGLQMEFKNIDADTLLYDNYYSVEIVPALMSDRSDRANFNLNRVDLNPGNAAIYYYRACLNWMSSSEYGKTFNENIDRWLRSKVGEFPVDEVNDYFARRPGLLSDLNTALKRRDCDWEFNYEDMDFTEFANHRLIEVQTLRSLSRLLRLKTRLYLAEGDLESAQKSIAYRIKLGKDVARIPMHVAALTGEDIISHALDDIAFMSQYPNTPNNGLALLSIPRPVIDSHQENAFLEQRLAERSFEILQSPETSQRTTQQWSHAFANALEVLDLCLGAEDRSSETTSDRLTRAAILLARLYPIAKRELIATGWKRDAVEAMPVGQVVAIQTKQVWDEWNAPLDTQNLATHDAVSKFRKRRAYLKRFYERSHGEFPLFDLVNFHERFSVPAASAVNRKLALIQNLEFVRDSVAKNDAFPNAEQLATMKLLPDPLTGKSFEYLHEGETLVMQAEPDSGSGTIRIEVKIKRE